MTLPFIPDNAFPLPAPLTPKLVALGLDSKNAATISQAYLSVALTLRDKWETEYIKACNALVVASDNRGYSSKELRAKLLTVTVARCGQAISKWMEEVIQKAEASVLKRSRQCIPLHRGKDDTNSGGNPERQPNKEGLKAASDLFSTNNPPHAFPRAYPPPVRPEPVSFVTHIPLLERGSGCKPGTISDKDLNACIDALSQLSLGPPPSRDSHKPSRPAPKSRSRTYTTSNPKPTSQLSPSCPRLVSPTLDTSVAVSHKPFPKSASPYPSPTSIPRTQNIDIPRSNRRKICPIPYQRPTIYPSSSPESPSFPRGIHRTPSLISDHGSEASSPSTPPDSPSMSIPTIALARKSSFHEAMSPFGYFPVNYSIGHGVDFGTNIYG